MVDIIPAILTDDPSVLEQEIAQAKKLCSCAQVDILDNSMISGKTVSPKDYEAFGKIFLVAHLMVDHPTSYLADLERAGFGRVIFHLESKEDPAKTILKIKHHGFEAGIALNSETDVPNLGKLAQFVDEILLLSVTPGKQGQKFQESITGKIAEVRDLYPDLLIGVDGGINDQNAPLLERVGANVLYVGDYLWGKNNPDKALKNLIIALNK